MEECEVQLKVPENWQVACGMQKSGMHDMKALNFDQHPPQEHRNRTEVAPFSEGAQSTHWSGENPAIGSLNGRFVLAGDAILSFYASATQRYRGFECMQQKDAKRYQVHGAMLDQDKVISTWVLELKLER
jgi:hypothetical protein